MYSVDNPAQPEVFRNGFSGMWWAIATLTTVGYGDIYPVTPLGKLIGTVVVILGIGLFALPAGILASGFVEVLQKRRNHERTVCPYCGRYIDGKGDDTFYVIEDGPAELMAMPKEVNFNEGVRGDKKD